MPSTAPHAIPKCPPRTYSIQTCTPKTHKGHKTWRGANRTCYKTTWKQLHVILSLAWS